MKILAALFAALTLMLTTAVATASAAEDDEPRNLYCDFLETFNPTQFAAYPPCNW